MKWNDEFVGKVAVITGAASGLGAQTARQFAVGGAKVVIGDIQVEKGKKVVADIKATGGDAIFVNTDVTSEEAVKNLIDTAINTYGTVDIMINNAGASIGLGAPFTRPTAEEWDQSYAINLRSQYLGCKYVYDLFKEKRSGKIVNVASVAGKQPDALLPAYSAMKAGTISVTVTLAKELGPYGINVNAICPGLIYTPIWEAGGEVIAALQPEKFPNMNGRQVFDACRTYLQALNAYEVTQEDIANGILFLCSSGATAITGQAINICAGMATER